MKSAKILLTTLGIFGIIGTTLAYKVRVEYVYYKENANGQCNVATTKMMYPTTDTNIIQRRLSVAATTGPCPLIRLTAAL
ncbi:hypothetical protein SAMN05661044_00698 [Olivibacter domesticus]|uniref:Uncharacterized protein n=1 Tax=Olivibacter domesticus TaxID=407022 RepID=A0A1H7IGN2_OLID1|nr:hypothetical protein SAMN05661044_00698 [Olivibacter domesticus]